MTMNWNAFFEAVTWLVTIAAWLSVFATSYAWVEDARYGGVALIVSFVIAVLGVGTIAGMGWAS